MGCSKARAFSTSHVRPPAPLPQRVLCVDRGRQWQRTRSLAAVPSLCLDGAASSFFRGHSASRSFVAAARASPGVLPLAALRLGLEPELAWRLGLELACGSLEPELEGCGSTRSGRRRLPTAVPRDGSSSPGLGLSASRHRS